MELIHEGEIKALFVMGFNPVVSNPNAGLVEEGLNHLDFLVVADMFMSETARFADLVLPVTSYMENEGTLTNLEGRVLLRKAAREAPGEALHDWMILCSIADRLGKGEYFDFHEPEEIFNELRLASKGALQTISASPMIDCAEMREYTGRVPPKKNRGRGFCSDNRSPIQTERPCFP